MIDITLAYDFPDDRAAVYFDTWDNGVRHANNTINTLAEDELVFGSNVVYSSDGKTEMRFHVNDRDEINEIYLEGINCLVDCEPEDIPEVEETEQDEFLNWSDPEAWPHRENQVPVEGEAVVVDSGMKLIYDIGESPLYKSVEINGDVIFKYSMPHVLNTYGLWVRAGTLTIGSEDEPFDSTAEIRLYGNDTSPGQFVFHAADVGSKNFLITGDVKLFGKIRNGSARLLKNAYPG